MSNIDNLRKHLSKDVPLVLTDEEGNENTFYLKPFNMKQQIVAFEISKKMKKLTGDKEDISDEERASLMDKDTLMSISDLLISVINRSFPDLTEEECEDFVSNNFEELFGILEELSPKSKEQTNAEMIQKRRGAAKNESNESSK